MTSQPATPRGSITKSRPDVTLAQVAEGFGVSVRTVKRWSKAGGWKKVGRYAAVTAEAHAAVDRVTRHIEKAGPNASEEDRRAATDAAVLEASAEQRAEVLKRHRSEPNIIRKLIGDAVRTGDPNRARLANDISRSLKVVHELERRAWGLDNHEDIKTIVIERD